ncbi:MAG: hypothetical protein H0Z35_00375 [Thermoanaerobacteraceae bacterium]|nr:hypothetical protein [Thermoanaerobacteraceae bacterium]
MKILSSEEKSMYKCLNNLVFFLGVLSTAVGLVYIFNLPKLTGDATWATVPWGWLALFIGVITLWVTIGEKRKQGFWRIILSVDLGVMVLLQIPPVLLWFIFNEQVIGEPTTPSAPMGHWLWSVPHIALAIVSFYSLYLLFFNKTTASG